MKRFVAILAVFSLLPVSVFAKDKNELSLDDLGIKQEEIKVDKVEMERMKTRRSMLSTHQILGMTTMALMTATLLTGEDAEHGDDETHKILGIASGLSYYTTAGYAFLSPEPKDERKASGSSAWHKRLAWIHFPLMLLTPVLGYLRHQDKEDGVASSGLVKSHGSVATAAYLTTILAGSLMVFEF